MITNVLPSFTVHSVHDCKCNVRNCLLSKSLLVVLLSNMPHNYDGYYIIILCAYVAFMLVVAVIVLYSPNDRLPERH